MQRALLNDCVASGVRRQQQLTMGLGQRLERMDARLWKVRPIRRDRLPDVRTHIEHHARFAPARKLKNTLLIGEWRFAFTPRTVGGVDARDGITQPVHGALGERFPVKLVQISLKSFEHGRRIISRLLRAHNA
jgi:hypothetical protein